MPEANILASIGLWPIPFAWLLAFLEKGFLVKCQEQERSSRFGNIRFSTLVEMVYVKSIPLYEFGLASSYFDSDFSAGIGVDSKLEKIAQTISRYVGKNPHAGSSQERLNHIPIWNRWMSTHPRYCLMVIKRYHELKKNY